MEASGKTTLLAGLALRLRAMARDVVLTREPGGTPLGDGVRALFVRPDVAVDPLAEAFLVNASRAQLVASVIEPALATGKTVLSDRFASATLAYQGYGRGLDLRVLRDLAAVSTRGIEPDVTLLVDLPPDVSAERVARRARDAGIPADRLEREGEGFHARVRDGYLALARSGARFAVLDGRLAVADLVEAGIAALRAKGRIA